MAVSRLSWCLLEGLVGHFRGLGAAPTEIPIWLACDRLLKIADSRQILSDALPDAFVLFPGTW